MKHIILAILIIVFLTGCKSASKPAGDAHAGHDMANMAAPAQQAQDSEPAIVDLDPAAVAKAHIVSVPAIFSTLTQDIQTTGRLAVPETKITVVSSLYAAFVEKMHVNTTGEFVRKNQPLVQLYSPELVAAQEEWLRARTWQSGLSTVNSTTAISDSAATLAEAARTRLIRLGVPASDIAKIAQSGKSVHALTLQSPSTGYILEKMAQPGMQIMPGEPIFRIADLSKIWVMIDIYEPDITRIKIGLPVKISIPALPGKTWVGRISWISPIMNPQTRTLSVRCVLNNPANQLKPDLPVMVQIQIPTKRALTVPATAIIDTGLRKLVYVDQGEGTYEARPVVTGITSGDRIQVISGLDEQEKVVRNGTFMVDSEARLRGLIAD